MTTDRPDARPGKTGDRRVVLIVGDSLGIGGLPDGPDPDADTLGHVAGSVGGLSLPTLGRWGIGNLTRVAGVPAVEDPAAVIGRLTPTSAGTDSTSGHWELMGYRLDEPFPTYPEGFPPEVIDPFEDAIGRPVLGNRPASGTVIIEELGEEHLHTGRPIVYTSADSVFQVAAHVEVVPLEQLYAWCETARGLLTGEHAVGRVIARPFRGVPGGFERTDDRRDLSLAPPGETALDRLSAGGVPVHGIGKIGDLFVGRGLHRSQHPGDDASAMTALEELLSDDGSGFVFVNLVDLDQRYGHRNDPEGYARALEAFDRRLGGLVRYLEPGDRLLVSADHGTDPTLTRTTDHTRELVPVLAWGPDLAGGRDLGRRSSMADVGATILDLFGLDPSLPGGGTLVRDGPLTPVRTSGVRPPGPEVLVPGRDVLLTVGDVDDGERVPGRPRAQHRRDPGRDPDRDRVGGHLSLADELTPTWATLEAGDLVAAVEALGGEGPIDLRVRPGAVELTAVVAGGAVWETALIGAEVSNDTEDGQRRTTVQRRALLGAFGATTGEAVQLRLAPNGAMTVGGVVLTPVRGGLREPPRPRASSVLRERLALPRSAAGLEMILRLDGPNVCIPEAVRERFSHRLVSSVSLFEQDGEWFISGVRNGTPTLVVVGAVGAY